MKQRWQGHILIELIEDSNGRIQNIAEIGVWKGQTARWILKKCHDIISSYWAIDPWNSSSPGGSRRARRLTDEQWEQLYWRVVNLTHWFPKLQIVRLTSLEAIEIFPDKYFDLVFLDADHSYEAVLNDIRAWMPKISNGGLLTGHDYERRSGVKKAVTECLGQIELIPEDIWVKRIEK